MAQDWRIALKRLHDNLAILRDLRSLRTLGYPLLIGLSRKSFIGAVLDKPVEQRLTGTVAAHMLALMNGADILRVHDVEEAVDTVKMFEAFRRSAIRRSAFRRTAAPPTSARG